MSRQRDWAQSYIQGQGQVTEEELTLGPRDMESADDCRLSRITGMLQLLLLQTHHQANKAKQQAVPVLLVERKEHGQGHSLAQHKEESFS